MPRVVVEISPVDEPHKGVLVVDWCIKNHCNYRCSYCPLSLHLGGLRGPTLAEARRIIDQISTASNRPWKHFQFTGGEPTGYKHLREVLEHLKELAHTAGLISNGSRTLSWWGRYLHLIDEITLTYHSELTVPDHLLALVALLHREVKTHVNVAMLPAKFHTCLDFADRLAASFEDISITLKPLLTDSSTSSTLIRNSRRRSCAPLGGRTSSLGPWSVPRARCGSISVMAIPRSSVQAVSLHLG
jgi:organic radical activating enzyme